jgi:hypothetical protein
MSRIIYKPYHFQTKFHVPFIRSNPIPLDHAFGRMEDGRFYAFPMSIIDVYGQEYACTDIIESPYQYRVEIIDGKKKLILNDDPKDFHFTLDGKLHNPAGPACDKQFFIHDKNITDQVEVWGKQFNIDIYNMTDNERMRFKLTFF